ELEPGEEVERLGVAEIAAVVQPARHGGQIFEADADVAGGLLEDRATLVLRQRPPVGALDDRDERGAGCFRSPEPRLHCDEAILLAACDVALVAGDAPKPPRGRCR